VTKSGHRFIHHFGNAARDELSIEGVLAEGNIFRLWQRFDGDENQIRFEPGDFSYNVYSTSGNPSAAARAIPGLVVRRGQEVIVDRICSQFTDSVFADEDDSALPEHSDAFSAM
jgi:hypothetical protein